ncbi:hypothetical protein Patl1_03686 [Pistacia atlantica]|uniref:Uncharacterized protein n=1 Tax=Pistacia atlantica TaxID=434234 RepID=A0ACC1BVZ3_9ROSI|nr:hypothetical protein Patl1_03686 [Pistacia atlantica]
MPQRSVVSWNAMISGNAQNGKFREAIEMFHEMQMGDVHPNYVNFVSILPAISRLGALELGKWVHLYAEEWIKEKKRRQWVERWFLQKMKSGHILAKEEEEEECP